MARNKGTFKFGANFEVQAAEAFDPRVVVETKADLINKETWPYDGDTIYVYNGMIVGVANDKTVWMLIDKTQITSGGYEGWKQIDSSSAITIGIVDNVTTDDPSQALSARQGKLLNDKITDITGKLTAIFTYKGTKATWAELEAVEDAQAGDVWNLEEAHENVPAGTNWVWNGSAWDALAGTVDLSGYVQKEEGKELIPTEKLTLIDTNATGIAENKGLITAEQQAREKADQELEKKIQAVKSYYEVPAAVLALTNGSQSEDVLAAVGGDWSAFITAIKKAQPVVSLKGSTGEGTENDTIIPFVVNYDKAADGNETVILSYVYNSVESTITLKKVAEVYSAAVTTKTFADNAKLVTVESTANQNKSDIAAANEKLTLIEGKADANTEAIATLNGEVGVVGSVKKTATDIADAKVTESLTWEEVE